ncbi:MAG: hypothetical protein L3K09_04480 [Thermoplasmata archaeon]|nr:hypothetical protein [Thermoplasmata archaeon]
MRARRASGGREGELLKRAARLRESVDSLLPKLSAGCPTDRFDRLRKDLEEVRAARDDEDRLERLSRRGDPIPRAYAGLLKFYLDEKLPGILVAPYPGGDLSFAPLGKASKEEQIAVQQSDDPKRLVLGYLRWARKGFHFFAAPNALYCTGKDPRPPAEFLTAQIAGLPYRLEARDGGRRYDCPHLAREEPNPYLSIDWEGAGTTIRVCRRCAKSDRQLLGALSQGIAVPKPERTFTIDASLNVDCHGGEECIHRRLPELPRGLRKRYLFGKVSDSELLDAYKGEVAPRIAQSREPLFVAAGHCYGADIPSFIEALKPSPEERIALAKVLPVVDGLFELDEVKASRALEKLWHDHAELIVEAIVPDPEKAQRLVREARASPGRVSELLARAARAGREEAVLAELPRYRSLSAEAQFVDQVARLYRGQGDRAAEKLILEALPREGKARGLAYGLLVVLEKERAHDWQFTDTEREFGRSLSALLGATLRSPPSAYHESMAALFAAAGVTDFGEREP